MHLFFLLKSCFLTYSFYWLQCFLFVWHLKKKGSPMPDTAIGVWSVNTFMCFRTHHYGVRWPVPFLFTSLWYQSIPRKFRKILWYLCLWGRGDLRAILVDPRAILVDLRDVLVDPRAVMVGKINPASSGGWTRATVMLDKCTNHFATMTLFLHYRFIIINYFICDSLRFCIENFVVFFMIIF